MMLGSQVDELRPFPWQPKKNAVLHARAPTSACRPGCSRSGCGARAATCSARSRSSTTATPTRSAPTRPASSTSSAPGAASGAARPQGASRRPAVPARYLLACADGHLDEFPYDLWVHHGQRLRAGRVPGAEDGRPHRRQGRLRDHRVRVVRAAPADERGPGRGRAGEAARVPRPAPAPRRVRAGRLRQRDPADAGRGVEPVVPRDAVDHRHAASRRRGAQRRPGRPDPGRARRRTWRQYRDEPRRASRRCSTDKVDVTELSDEELADAGGAGARAAGRPPRSSEERLRDWDPVDLLVPEWRYLQKDPLGPHAGRAPAD